MAISNDHLAGSLPTSLGSYQPNKHELFTNIPVQGGFLQLIQDGILVAMDLAPTGVVMAV
ncbi:hypothetical protein N7488_012327 [Penicillium malachiteum]|nr:hypothetical protein N7488_012327 [Penicillium malachiteum]